MAEKPSFDEWLGKPVTSGEQKPSFDEWLNKPVSSAGVTGYFGHVGKEVMEAFKHTTGENIGLDPKSEEQLKKLGIHDYAMHTAPIVGGLVRPAAAALDVFMGGLVGGFKLYQEGVTEAGRRMEGGAIDRGLKSVLGPGGGITKLTRDIAAYPESIGSLYPGHGIKTGMQINRTLLREAQAHGITGTEAHYRGISDGVEIEPIKVDVGATPEPRVGVDIAPLEVAATEAPRTPVPSVREKVAQDLLAAGRSQEEADAYAALMSARYEARAARLGVSADELYAESGPEIRAGRGVKAGEREFAQDGSELYQGEAPTFYSTVAKTVDAAQQTKAPPEQWLATIREQGHTDAKVHALDITPALRDAAVEQGFPLFQTRKGKINVREGQRNIITMLKEADASTFGHEAGHQFLEELITDARDARAPADLVRDRNIVMDWLDAKRDTEITVKQHEKFARGFEAYLREGKAPTKELEGVFARFRDWLLRIYRSVRELRVEINDDIRGVFDRLIAIEPEVRIPGAADRLIKQSEPEFAGRMSEVRGPASKPEKQQTLIEFLADRGGLKPDPELATILGGKNRFVPGFGNLLRKNGMSLDKAREAAVEAGYIIDSGADAGRETTSTIGHLLDKIDQEARGTKQYREGELENRPTFETAEVRAQRMEHYDSEFSAYLDEANLPRNTVNDATRNRVIQLMDREGMTADAAYERAMMEATDNAAQATGTAEPIGLGEEIPGWNVPDDAGTVSQAGREPAGDGAPLPRPSVREPVPIEAAPTDAHRTVPAADPKRIDKAGNIRLDNLNTPEDVNAVLREAAELNGEFMRERRGVMSDAEVMSLADALGMDPAKLNRRKIGQAFNAEEVIAARKLLIKSATEVADLAKRAASGLEPDVMAYAEAKARFHMIEGQVSGLTAEAGRALRAFRSLEGMDEAKSISTFLQEKTGKTLFQLQEEARKLAALDTPAKMAKFLQDSKKPKFIDYALEYWINAILSGPVTHVTNMMSNEGIHWFHLPEHALTAAIGGVRSKLTGSKERAYLGEVKQALFSELRGGADGLRAAWEVLKNEEAMVGGRQIEVRKKATPGPVGDVIRAPGRALMAEDMIFKARAYAQSFAEQAYRAAKDKGLDGKELDIEVARLRNNPTEAMIKEAHKFGDYQTFTNRLGESGKTLQLFLARTPILKFIAPFVQTPLNILKYGAERSIAAPLFKQVRADLKGENGAIARDRAQAKIALGTAVQASAVLYIMNDMITGAAPTEPDERSMWYASGKQPYSIRIGDNWYSYQRIEPLASFFGIMADAKQVWDHIGDEDQGNLAKLISASVINNVMNKTWLQGPAEAVKAMSEPERYGTRWINRFVTSFIPAFVAQPAGMMDPYIREARTLVDAAKARIPGLSQTLPPKRGIWGEPIERDVGIGYVTPIKVSPDNKDPVTAEFQRLGVFPGALRREIVGQKLTDQEYDDYTRIAGRTAKHALDQLINAPWFSSVPDHVKSDLMLKTVDRAREQARAVMKMQNPRIMFDAVAEKRALATGQ